MKHVKIVDKSGYAILELNRGRANPMNHEMIREIHAALQQILQDKNLRGIILTGNTPGYFSVGLDLKEIFYYNEAEIVQFWRDWEALIMQLVEFPKPIVAAINGYSPAGGCVLAITCDYRIMAEDLKFKIGLNEIAVGIAVPSYIYQLFSYWSGSRLAYQSLLKARLFNPSEAKEIGLVDEICSLDELTSKAEQQMEQILMAPDNLISQSKKNMRSDLVKLIKGNAKVSREEKLKAWFDPKSRAVMKSVVDQLTQKSNKS